MGIVNASNYVATVTATASADGTATTIDWESTFEAAADVNMDGLKADLAGFYGLFITTVNATLNPPVVTPDSGEGSGEGGDKASADYTLPSVLAVAAGAACAGLF